MNNKIIAYQGVQGAYSHLACQNIFPESETIACESFTDAMKLVESKKASFAVIPLENSTAGRVEEIYRLIPKLSLYIIDEHYEPVNHCLLGVKGATKQDIQYVSSHPQALAQCHENITSLGYKALAKFDTAGSAKEVSESNNKKYGAIASKLAASLYDLEILNESFEDLNGNVTRFIVLSHEIHIPVPIKNEEYIISLVFQVRDIPAALYKALGGFATNSVNIIKLESYATPGSMAVSLFHIDIEAYPNETRYKLALEELEFFAKHVRCLGVYKKFSNVSADQLVS